VALKGRDACGFDYSAAEQAHELFDGRKLITDVGTVLSLEDARIAHEMLTHRQRRRGKIVLSVDSRSVATTLSAAMHAAI
jgi:hypothetical protein